MLLQRHKDEDRLQWIAGQVNLLQLKWISQYLRHFLTEMAEIWSPATFFKDVWTCKISALYLLYFLSYHNIYWKSLNKSLKVLKLKKYKR